ncbi:cupin domain-containing protein [Microbispora sp. NPDC088329]|uniref:cupin domain-containing protein n=1 Tax=Microbispora sp. NPDC088329 TaxID=3154869 RepID=UPI0034229ECB
MKSDKSFIGTPCVVHAAALADADLDADPLDPAQIVSGAPEVRHLELASGTDLAVGVWQHGPGVSTDTEADEVFVVLGGSATIEVEDGPVLDVGPGDVVLMPAGARTVWTVHETLRKVYAVRT